MFNIEVIKSTIIEHMKSANMFNPRSGITKPNILIIVARKLGIPEFQEYLIENALDILIREDIVRSSYNLYDENGKYIGVSVTFDEEKFYLNRDKIV